MVFLLFLVVVIGAVHGFENDCIDKCTCQNNVIWCQYIFDQPKVIVTAPEKVDAIYISYSDIRNRSFVDHFPNLKILSFFEVSINCTLLQEKRLTRTFSVVAPSCSGIYSVCSLLIMIAYFESV